MYWSRTGQLVDIFAWLLLSGLWSLGGWALATHVFRLRPVERLVAGIATGMIAFIVVANLLVQVSTPVAGFWIAAFIIFAAGLAAAWRSPVRPVLDLHDLRHWQPAAALIAVTVLVTLTGRGLALFDDYLHIPLISIMATGDIPPHFYLDPAQPMAYHYGLQVLAASMVRLGGFFPWSAWDITKALATALTLVTGWFWLRRATHNLRAATLGSLLLLFAGGARWLLLFLPSSWLAWMSSDVALGPTAAASGPNLLAVLSRPWLIEGGGPFPFPFAFHNGIFVPITFILGSTGALPFLTVLLLLLLASTRRFTLPAVAVYSLIMASLALSAEHLFVLLWGGIALAGLAGIIYSRARRKVVPRETWIAWATILAISGLLSLIQGGYITEVMRSLLERLGGGAPPAGPYNYFTFTPRWPPGLLSGHLGELSFLNPRQVLVLLAELGPALLLAPVACLAAWRGLRRGDWLLAGLGIAGLISMLLPVFFRYGFERSATRLPATALWIWVLLSFPLLWLSYQHARSGVRFGLQLLYGSLVLGGMVIFAIQLTAIPAPQLTYFIAPMDAQISREFWDRLPKGTQVLDPSPSRSVAMFGQATRAYEDVYKPYSDWSALIDQADPAAIAQAGYQYVYLDKKWWRKMSDQQHEAFQQDCVEKTAEAELPDGDFRWLLNVEACR